MINFFIFLNSFFRCNFLIFVKFSFSRLNFWAESINWDIQGATVELILRTFGKINTYRWILSGLILNHWELITSLLFFEVNFLCFCEINYVKCFSLFLFCVINCGEDESICSKTLCLWTILNLFRVLHDILAGCLLSFQGFYDRAQLVLSSELLRLKIDSLIFQLLGNFFHSLLISLFVDVSF